MCFGVIVTITPCEHLHWIPHITLSVLKFFPASPWLRSQLKSLEALFDRTYSQFDSGSLLHQNNIPIHRFHSFQRFPSQYSDA